MVAGVLRLATIIWTRNIADDIDNYADDDDGWGLLRHSRHLGHNRFERLSGSNRFQLSWRISARISTLRSLVQERTVSDKPHDPHAYITTKELARRLGAQ